MSGKREQKKNSNRKQSGSTRKKANYAKPKLVSRGKLKELVVRAQCMAYSVA